MSKLEERIEKIKASASLKKAKRKNPVKTAKWKTLAVSLLTLASTSFAKANTNMVQTDNDTVKTEQTANTPPQYFGDNDAALRQEAAELAANPDFMARFLVEEGENIAGNFNLCAMDMTEDMAYGIEAGEDSKLLNKYALAPNRANPDGRHCYAGTKAILKKHGILLSGEHAYMAAEQLRAIPAFTEVKCSYEMLPLMPNGTVVVQGKGTTRSGHIFVIAEQGGKKVQKCGQTYSLPTSNRRGSSGQKYGDLSVFVPSDCALELGLTADLYADGHYKQDATEQLTQSMKEENASVIGPDLSKKSAEILQADGIKMITPDLIPPASIKAQASQQSTLTQQIVERRKNTRNS